LDTQFATTAYYFYKFSLQFFDLILNKNILMITNKKSSFKILNFGYLVTFTFQQVFHKKFNHSYMTKIDNFHFLAFVFIPKNSVVVFLFHSFHVFISFFLPSDCSTSKVFRYTFSFILQCLRLIFN